MLFKMSEFSTQIQWFLLQKRILLLWRNHLSDLGIVHFVQCYMLVSYKYDIYIYAYILQMQFFEKYKQLFGVADKSINSNPPLQLNNQLFITKAHLPTYQHEYSIENKIRAFKKDYAQLTTKSIPSPPPSLKKITKHPKYQREEYYEQEGYKSQKQYSKIQDPITQSVPNPRHSSRVKDMNVVKQSQFQYLFNSKLSTPLPEVRTGLLPRTLNPIEAPPVLSPMIDKDYLKLDNSISKKGQLLAFKKIAKDRRMRAKSALPLRRQKLKKLLQL